MKSSTTVLWRTLGVSTLLCLIAMLTGFGWALKDHWFPADMSALPKASETAPVAGGGWIDKNELFVTALGDSLTKGTGDATGKGYVTRVIEGLADTADKPVRLVNNLAVNGMRADELTNHLDEKGFVNAIAKADIVLLTIGGNDLFQIARTGGSTAEGGDLSPEALRERLPEIKPRLKAAFDKIRRANPQARIVYTALYNAFYDIPAIKGTVGEVVAEWNDYAYRLALADGNATVVPTYDLFEVRLAEYLSSDHFHPNAAGYERMADRIVEAIR